MHTQAHMHGPWQGPPVAPQYCALHARPQLGRALRARISRWASHAGVSMSLAFGVRCMRCMSTCTRHCSRDVCATHACASGDAPSNHCASWMVQHPAPCMMPTHPGCRPGPQQMKRRAYVSSCKSASQVVVAGRSFHTPYYVVRMQCQCGRQHTRRMHYTGSNTCNTCIRQHFPRHQHHRQEWHHTPVRLIPPRIHGVNLLQRKWRHAHILPDRSDDLGTSQCGCRRRGSRGSRLL